MEDLNSKNDTNFMKMYFWGFSGSLIIRSQISEIQDGGSNMVTRIRRTMLIQCKIGIWIFLELLIANSI